MQSWVVSYYSAFVKLTKISAAKRNLICSSRKRCRWGKTNANQEILSVFPFWYRSSAAVLEGLVLVLSLFLFLHIDFDVKFRINLGFMMVMVISN